MTEGEQGDKERVDRVIENGQDEEVGGRVTEGGQCEE